MVTCSESESYNYGRWILLKDWRWGPKSFARIWDSSDVKYPKSNIISSKALVFLVFGVEQES